MHNRNKHFYRGGFTIIELIVVIAIIGILAAIVMINVTKYIKSAQDVQSFSNLKQLAPLATQYYVDNKQMDYFCNSPEVTRILDGVGSDKGHYTCTDESIQYTTGSGAINAAGSGGQPDQWCIYVSTSLGCHCIDSTGKVGTSCPGAGSLVFSCP